MTGSGARVAVLNPPHLGELVRHSVDDLGWHAPETSTRLVSRGSALSRLLSRESRQSANNLLALEALGWGPADHRLVQRSHERVLATLAVRAYPQCPHPLRAL